MDTAIVQRRWYARKPLAALGKLTAAALAAMLLLLVDATVQFGFYPPVLPFMLLALILAAVVATGARWAPLLGVFLYGGLLALAGPYLPYALSQPSETFMFSFMVIFLVLAIVGIGAGIGATIQNYRSTERHTPRWLAPALTGLIGLAVGAVLVAMIPTAGASSGISPEALAGLPMLTTRNFRFEQAVIHAKVGETVALRLENRDPTGHTLELEAFNIHVPMNPGKTGLAVFKPTKPGIYTFYCGVPGHYNKATGQGMSGTLVVEQ